MLEQWSRVVVGTPSPSVRLRPASLLWVIVAAVVLLAAAAWYGVRAGREAERLGHGARLVATAQYAAGVRALPPVVAAAPEQPLGTTTSASRTAGWAFRPPPWRSSRRPSGWHRRTRGSTPASARPIGTPARRPERWPSWRTRRV
jgi:hypothetical protein